MTSRDVTFRAFTPDQAAQYAAGRGGAYPEPIYQTIIEYHMGKRELCLDIGTGPGKAVWDLLKYFDHCIGCDTSIQMIEQAKKDAISKGVSDKANFFVASGEECASALSQANSEQADIITVAMAAHWLDLPAFYASAAQALRPHGTLAIWTCSSWRCHRSIPNYEAIQAAFSDLEDNMLGPYMTPGNRLSRDAYDKLPLPWTIADKQIAFDKSSFQRSDWDRGGVPSSPPLPDGTPGPFLFGRSASLKEWEAAFSSASAVIRWREANPESAGTAADPLKITAKRLQEAMGDNEKLVMAPSCSLLLMRKS